MSTLPELNEADKKCLEEIALFWKMSIHELLWKIHGSAKDGICSTMPNNEIRMTYEINMFLNACDRIPAHTACQICRKLNLQFDDCGFFYKTHERNEITPPRIADENLLKKRDDIYYYLTYCADCGTPNTAER